MADNTITLNMKEHKELFWGGASIPKDSRYFSEGGGIIFETNAKEMEINASLTNNQKNKDQTVSPTVLRGICVSISDDKGATWRDCRVVSSGTSHTAKYPIFRYASRSPVYVAVFFPLIESVTDMEIKLFRNKEIRVSPINLKGNCLFIGGPITYGAGIQYTFDTLPNLVLQRSLINIYNNSKNTWDYTEYYMDGALLELNPDVVVMECCILKKNDRKALREFVNYIIHLHECLPELNLILWLSPYGKDMTESAEGRLATIDALKKAVAGNKRVSVLDASEILCDDKKNISEAALKGLAGAICDYMLHDPILREKLQSDGSQMPYYKKGDKDEGAITDEVSVVPAVVEEAQTRFEIPDGKVITADVSANLETALDGAGRMAAEGDPVIVYAPQGVYRIQNKLTIPENVTLVAEQESVFEAVPSDILSQLITIHGNIYGGTYDCKDMTLYGLRFGSDAFRRNNGIIERVCVRGAKKDGIIATGSDTRFACMYDSIVSDCGGSGLAAEEGAWIAVASGNDCSNNKESGIKLVNANINIINNNTINDNGTYGIVTELSAECEDDAACQIHKMVNNEISRNGADGVLISENCCVDVSFAKNDIRENGRNGLSVDKNAFVNAMVKNRLNGNRNVNIFVAGDNSSVNLGNSNVIQKANINISVSEAGIVKITGDNNRVLTAVTCGIVVNNGGELQIIGSANRIAGNGVAGIKLTGNSSAKIVNTIFKKNKKYAVHVDSKSTIEYDDSSNLGKGKEAENIVKIEG